MDDNTPTPSTKLSIGPTPFVGGRPFVAGDEAYFFGRDRDAARLTNVIAANTLTVLYGQSGVGKSSMLNARLPKELHRITRHWIFVAFSEWQRGFELKLRNTLDQQLGLPALSWSETDDGCVIANKLIEAARLRGAPVMLIFDQFEEYFLYHPSGHERFEDALVELGRLENGPVRILLSLRRDSLFLLDRLRPMLPDIYGAMVALDPLDRVSAEAAIRQPIDVYNTTLTNEGWRIEPPDDGLIAAIIDGADENQIRRGIQGNKRQTNLNPDRPVRVVAWFLQLAVDAVWQKDIVADNGSMLRLSSLRSLAGLTSRDQDAVAVRRLVQAHVGRVLGRLSHKDRDLCAYLFDSMITRSGSKIAVKLPDDFEGVLEGSDLQRAGPLLERLAMAAGSDRLIHKVAPPEETGSIDASGEMSRPEALGLLETSQLAGKPQREDGARYEIMHDALAAPLRVWVAARREQWRLRKLVRNVLATVIGVMLLGFALYSYQTLTVQLDIIKNAKRFASSNSDAGPRPRILALLAAIDGAEGILTQTGLADAQQLRTLLSQTVMRSPRWGGAGIAAGIDAEGTHLVLIGPTGPPVAGPPPENHTLIYELRPDTSAHTACFGTDAADHGSTQQPATLKAPDFFTRAAEPLSFMPGQNSRFLPGNDAIGFVNGGKCPMPVAYHEGELAYWKNQTWSKVRLENLIGNYSQLAIGPSALPTQIMVEIQPSAVQVRLFNPSEPSLRAASIRGDASTSTGLSNDAQFSSSVQLQRMRPSQSVLSPDVGYVAAFDQVPPHPQAGQLTYPVLVVTSLLDPKFNMRAQIAPSRPVGGFGPAYSRSLSAVFVQDTKKFVVYRDPSTVGVMDLSEDESSSVMKFAVPPEFAAVIPTQSYYPPPFAAVRVQAEWRFAWLSDRGIIVLDSDTRGDLQKSNLHLASQAPLLTSIQNGMRLSFSRDGRTLSLVRAVRPGAPQEIQIWDLSPEWRAAVSEHPADLTVTACRFAAIGADNNQLSPEEMDRALHHTVQQPCPN